MSTYERKFDYRKLDELHRSDPSREFTVQEIAQAAGISRRAVYDIEARALKKLRQAIEARSTKLGTAGR